MKLIDLFEGQRIIEGDIKVPYSTKKLNYKGAIVKGNFDCSNGKITSLGGAPSYVEGDFSCIYTKITSLGGAPSYVGTDFYCNNTGITSLHGIHKQVKHIGGGLWLPRIRSHGLGIMFIKGLQRIDIRSSALDAQRFEKIINKHLAGKRNPHECQEELIEAGLSEYAKL